MKSETQVELNEESLKAFIAERATTVNEAKDRTITKLKKEVKRLKKEQDSNGTETDIETLKQARSYLKEVPDDYLMSVALLDRTALWEKYANSGTGKRRAVFMFSSDEAIKAEVAAFQEQFPKLKKNRKKLLPKFEKNFDTSLLVWSGTEGEVAGGETNDTDVAANENGVVLKTKKRKTPDDSICSLGKENFSNSGTNETQDGFRDNGGSSKKKKKHNAIDKLLAKGRAALAGNPDPHLTEGAKDNENQNRITFDDDSDADGAEHSGNADSNDAEHSGNADSNGITNNWFKHTNGKEGNFQNGHSESPKKNQWNNNRGDSYGDFNRTPRGGFMGRNNSGREFRGRSRGRDRGGRGRDRDGGQQQKWSAIKRFIPRDSANRVSVTDDWKTLADKPKTDEDEQKPSLLRPLWLTNPEEFKKTNESTDTFGQGRGNWRSNRGRRGGFRGRGRR